MQYKIKRENSTFIFQNLSDNVFYISLYKSLNGDIADDYTIVLYERKVLNRNSYTFVLPPEDGLYKIIITDRNFTENIFVPKYHVILSSLIDDIDYVLCGCGCSNCGKDDLDVTSVLLKILSYNSINRDVYTHNISSTSKCIESDILEISNCNLLLENITGNVENNSLLKKLISYYYLIYYYTDLLLIKDESSVKELYHFSKIFPCVKKYISNPNCIFLNCIPTNYNEFDTISILKDIETLRKDLNSKQNKFINELQIDYWTNGSALDLPVNIPSGKIAYVNGVLFEFIRNSVTSFQWQRYGNNGIPSSDTIYVYNTDRFIWNEKMIKIGKEIVNDIIDGGTSIN